jgi:hypothetical protein
MSFDKDSIKTVKQALEICKSYRTKKEALEEFASADAAIQAKIQEYDAIIQNCTQLVMFGDLPHGGSSPSSSSQSGSIVSHAVINSAFTRMFGTSKFQGISPQETDNFLGLADSFYKSYIVNRVSGEPDMEKEQFFLSCLRAHLDVAPCRAIADRLDKCTNFKDAKLLINQQFGGKLNHLLVIGEAAAMEFDVDLPMQDYAGKISTKLNEAYEACTREFKRVHKDRQMTVQDCFSLFGTHLLTEQLRLKTPDLYNMLLNKMSDIFKPDELAAAAESLRRNMTPTEANVHYIGNRRDGKQKNGNNKKGNHRPRGKGSKQNGANKEHDSGNGEKDPQVHSAAAAPDDDDIFGAPITLACINHAAPVYKSAPSLVPDPFLASATFAHDNCCFETDVEIDSGSFATILPKKIVPQEMLSKLKPSPFMISGIDDNATRPLGFLEMSVNFGSGPLLDATVFVMENSPSLLGRDILRCREIRSSELGRNYLRLNFNGRYKSIPPQKVQLKQVGFANLGGEVEVHQVSKGSPILWVKQNLDVDLLEHAPLDNDGLIATDVNKVQAASAPTCFLREFPETAGDRTVRPGEVQNHKQTSVPQAQTSHVDELSDNLLENDVFVKHDPQVSPFLSPISDLADIHGESSSKGDDSWETKLNCIENSSPEKLTTSCQPTNSCAEQVPAATTSSEPATSLPAEILPSDDATFSTFVTSQNDEQKFSVLLAGSLDCYGANQHPRDKSTVDAEKCSHAPVRIAASAVKEKRDSVPPAPPYLRRNCSAPNCMNITSTRTEKFQ